MTTPIATTSGTAGAAQAASSTAPAAVGPTDFMMLLTQIVGQPAQEAITPIPTQDVGSRATESLESDELLPSDAMELLPFALPMQHREGTWSGLPFAAQTGAMPPGAPIGHNASAASQVQLVTDMIAGEQMVEVTSADGDVLQLPLSGTDAAHARAQSVDQVTRPIHVPVGNAQWADELGARLTTMTEQGRQAASLRLSPEHLGPLEIRIAIRDDQASVWFGAAHADTRAAIEHALPRLREMFEAQGMSLTDAGVFHEAPREHPQPAMSTHAALGQGGEVEEPAPLSIPVNVGLVDAYA